jgi:hypothetical protein
MKRPAAPNAVPCQPCNRVRRSIANSTHSEVLKSKPAVVPTVSRRCAFLLSAIGSVAKPCRTCHRDYSRLSCCVRDTQLGPSAISAGMREMGRNCRDFCRSKDDPAPANPATPLLTLRWRCSAARRRRGRSLGGRPKIDAELRALIRRMSAENPLWGAPRIHGELLKLGFEVGQSSVAKYMVKRRGPPSQGWRTFLRNHAPDIAAGTVRCSDHWFRSALCHRHRSAGPPRPCLDQCHISSDRGMDCPARSRSFPLE